MPESGAAFRKVAAGAEEQGIFVVGPRLQWITVDPDSAVMEEVLVHEYLHAVLHRRQPGLPRWLEEGICEYYSTLRYGSRGGKRWLELGAAPGQKLRILRSGTEWNLRRLQGAGAGFSRTGFPVEAYAWAWAHVHLALAEKELPVLLRTYQEHAWKAARSEDGYAVKVRAARGAEPVVTRALSGAVAAEMRAGAAQAFEKNAGEAPGEASFLEGLRLLDEGKTGEARERLEEAVRRSPSQSSWWLTLAEAYGALQLRELQREATQRAFHTAVTETEKRAAEAARRAIE